MSLFANLPFAIVALANEYHGAIKMNCYSFDRLYGTNTSVHLSKDFWKDGQEQLHIYTHHLKSTERILNSWQGFWTHGENSKMRKVIFQEFLSLDGYAADKQNSTKFFEGPEFAEESDEDLLAEMDRFDTILLGANTYKMFVEFWPDASISEQVVADKLNSIPKIVFSRTIKNAPWGKWAPATVIAEGAVAAITKLKKQPGRDMVLWGSISLAQDLMKANLIDEYQLRIVPVILGGGKLLFSEQDQLNLELTKTKTYPSGLLLVHYRPPARPISKLAN